MIISHDGLLDLKLKVPHQLAQRLITRAAIPTTNASDPNHHALLSETSADHVEKVLDHPVQLSTTTTTAFPFSGHHSSGLNIKSRNDHENINNYNNSNQYLEEGANRDKHEYKVINIMHGWKGEHPGPQNENDLFSFFLTYSSAYVINLLCVLCLLILIMDFSSSPILSGQTKQQCNGCMYLMISPITNSGLIFFNIHHKNSKRLTFGMAMTSLLLGNVAGIIYCASLPPPILLQGMDLGLLCLSMSLIIGAFQLLMLMSKTNVPIVMISTASVVVICGLSSAALFLSSAASRRCYQSTIPCILWLLWQAAQKRRQTS